MRNIIGKLKNKVLSGVYTDTDFAAQKIMQLADRYRSIIDSQSDLICRFASDGTITFANAAFCDYFHKEQEEILGINVMSLLNKSRDELSRLVGTLDNKPSVTELRCDNKGSSGEINWCRFIYTKVSDSVIKEIQLIGHKVDWEIMGVSLDMHHIEKADHIDEAHGIEEINHIDEARGIDKVDYIDEARGIEEIDHIGEAHGIDKFDHIDEAQKFSNNPEAESEVFEGNVYDMVSWPVVVLEPDLTICSCNKMFAAFSGYSRDEAIGQELFSILVLPDFLEMLSYSELAKKPGDAELQCVDRFGNIRDVIINTSRLRKDGKLVLSFVDVTKKYVDNDLIKTLNNESIIVICKITGTVLAINRNCENATGLYCEQVKGMKYWDALCLESERKITQHIFKNIVVDKGMIESKQNWKTATGRAQAMELKNFALLDLNGNIEYIVIAGKVAID